LSGAEFSAEDEIAASVEKAKAEGRATVEGRLVLTELPESWESRLMLCDFDGIPFTLDNLEALSGNYVRLTIEVVQPPSDWDPA